MRKYSVPIEDIGKGTKLLIVDDEVGIIDALTAFFKRCGFDAEGTTSPITAIEKVKKEHYDIIILDYLMAPIHGDEVVKSIRAFNSNIYILLLTGHKDLAPPAETLKLLDIQGYCEKSDKFDQLLLLVESGVKYIGQIKEIEKNETDIKKAYFDTVNLLRDIVDMKDNYTRHHSENVSYLAGLLGEKLGLNTSDVNTLKTAGLFHDIGKIAIPDAILGKTEALTNEEYEIMKRHPVFGSKLLSKTDMFTHVVDCIKCHHERYDGKGYPDGLSKEDIPYMARILSVVDAFDAMRTKRSYKESYDLDFVISEIKKCSGTQFDSDIVNVFIDVFEKNREDILKQLKN